ncbi:MAG: hypothetical protein H6684_15955 [Deltaproteobacteria bacterium]|nr:hypothetical protein [Deltaproteobacteria bacterium]MCB9490225.1 hypothetical protein [Deltaproteobacteria bacterium]
MSRNLEFAVRYLMLILLVLGLAGASLACGGDDDDDDDDAVSDDDTGDDDTGDDDTGDDDTGDDDTGDDDTGDDDTGDDDTGDDDTGDDDTGDDDTGDDDTGDDDTGDDDTGDDDTGDDDTGDDDTGDDDTGDDDTGDDDIDDPFEPWENPEAKADAFPLFYKERVHRIVQGHNRFLLVNDVVPAMTLGHAFIDKHGDDYTMLLHPKDNNDIGHAAMRTWAAYKLYHTRELELTLIRMFEGLAAAEEVTGHSGMTSREYQPGWTLTIDGFTGDISRDRFGDEITPAVTFDSALEDEIVDTFFADGVYTFLANPADYYFNAEAVQNPSEFATTLVFHYLPKYMHISNCCSSFMRTPDGPYEGYFWGNHNSRDNFPDYGLGYMTALDCINDPSASDELKDSCQRAWDAGQRIGDSVVAYDYNLMTVTEWGDSYDDLIVAGELRPDGTDEGPEWLGSMNNCIMSYMAKALSEDGLHSADEYAEAPGAYEIVYIYALFDLLGIPRPEWTKECHSLDDGYFGLSWSDLYERKFAGLTMPQAMTLLINLIPDVGVDLVKNIVEGLDQPQRAAAAVVYYAELQGNQALLVEAKKTLYNISEVGRQFAIVLRNWAEKDNNDPNLAAAMTREIYDFATYVHAFGVGDEGFDPGDFEPGIQDGDRYDAVLSIGDTSPYALKTDEQIRTSILNALDGGREKVVERYWAAYPDINNPPIKRKGDAYEAIGADGEFHDIPNVGYQWFGAELMREMPICWRHPESLDCTWALLGCERPDLDGSGEVDETDGGIFDSAYATYGPPANTPCNVGNDWCGGADLDHSGLADAEDVEFMAVADGCWYEAP